MKNIDELMSMAKLSNLMNSRKEKFYGFSPSLVRSLPLPALRRWFINIYLRIILMM